MGHGSHGSWVTLTDPFPALPKTALAYARAVKTHISYTDTEQTEQN